jgi:uncharacterized protein (DUF934 family)
MNTVVNAEGFRQKDAEEKGFAIDSSVDLAELQACLEHPRVSICASSFADGRVFTLARQLRADGFAGVIRVCCDLLPDQFAMALRSGIDEVEISEAHANRCKEPVWLARAEQRSIHYQGRLGRRDPAGFQAND